LKPYGVCYNTVTKIIVAGEVAHGMVQGVALSSNPSTTKNQKKKTPKQKPVCTITNQRIQEALFG
jgi:hypothetical protein